MRHIVSTAIVAVVVSLVTVTTMGALAQEPAAVTPAAVSDINAHRVDGRHAVGFGASPAQRAGKLVATNAQGRLPSNILKPDWDLMVDVPTGIADGVDDAGVTGITLTTITEGFNVPAGESAANSALCPAGKVVSGGFLQPAADIVLTSSFPTGPTGWSVVVNSDSGIGRTVTMYMICMSVTPGGELTAAKSTRR